MLYVPAVRKIFQDFTNPTGDIVLVGKVIAKKAVEAGYSLFEHEDKIYSCGVVHATSDTGNKTSWWYQSTNLTIEEFQESS